MIKNDIEKILGFEVEATENSDFGDYTSNIAFKSKTPVEKIVSDLKQNKKLTKFIERIESVGKFINLWLKKDVLIDNLIEIGREKDKYGNSDFGNGKLVIVEYSSPNIAKPFGVGHLRSTVIGDAIANLMEATGWKVMRDNHLGDWGTQFGKMIYAIKTWGNETAIEKSENPVGELVKLYVKFHEQAKKNESLENSARAWFKKLEEGDAEARRLWQKCTDWSWVEFEKIYQLLNIRFNKEFNNSKGLGESFFEDKMKVVIEDLETKKLLKVGEDGAKLVFFDPPNGEASKYPPAMIVKSDGATLYATRDLATDKYRLEKYNPDLIINEVGSEQSLYFNQLFEIEKLLGWYREGQRVHVGHGLYLTGGKKMSTRGGESVDLGQVLEESVKRAKKLGNDNEEVARAVGVGAIKYFDLSHHPLTNINFDWDSMFALEGNSGPYLQYTVARANSVLAKLSVTNFQFSMNFQLNNEELAILRTLVRFSEVITNAAKTYSPNLLCNYLYDLASKFNTFYNKHKIIGGMNYELRIMLTKATGQVLKNGLNLLGIQTPERM